ncbi:ribosomal-protein-alanine N-acetyltransferase [candidate division WOR-3 bacterium 4484_100]|uniref:[Ribosomal protein bS18]-alanine N-acetyltransferase n=1 Tax=candidate division WOR-3 bacterium 4484_100 TaxID=1936077 RepID=A0A1V4QGJ6_UNCW3|nr:MAG: ribosomal-protein-alanine N-acetyltransferase [candidate division WOR-3 bacterium 4484_100]
MLKELLIRKMQLSDLDQVYELEKRSFPNPWPRYFFEQDLNKEDAVALVIEHNKTIIAYALAKFEGEKFHITNIAVAKEYQSQGIGKKLMKRLEDAAQKKSCNILYLEVRKSNITAINFYRKLGYRIESICRYYYINGDDAYIMKKELL